VANPRETPSEKADLGFCLSGPHETGLSSRFRVSPPYQTPDLCHVSAKKWQRGGGQPEAAGATVRTESGAPKRRRRKKTPPRGAVLDDGGMAARRALPGLGKPGREPEDRWYIRMRGWSSELTGGNFPSNGPQTGYLFEAGGSPLLRQRRGVSNAGKKYYKRSVEPCGPKVKPKTVNTWNMCDFLRFSYI